MLENISKKYKNIDNLGLEFYHLIAKNPIGSIALHQSAQLYMYYGAITALTNDWLCATVARCVNPVLLTGKLDVYDCYRCWMNRPRSLRSSWTCGTASDANNKPSVYEP
jgi:hypothetical protein